MQRLPRLTQQINPLTYEIVERGFRRAKVVVFIEQVNKESLYIRTHKNKIIIVGYFEDKEYYCIIDLWFRPKKIHYIVNNGVMTINITGKRYLIF